MRVHAYTKWSKTRLVSQYPTTGVSQPVPRHREIKEHLARHIIRMLCKKGENGEG